jgi:hypothetical protein
MEQDRAYSLDADLVNPSMLDDMPILGTDEMAQPDFNRNHEELTKELEEKGAEFGQFIDQLLEPAHEESVPAALPVVQ